MVKNKIRIPIFSLQNPGFQNHILLTSDYTQYHHSSNYRHFITVYQNDGLETFLELQYSLSLYCVFSQNNQ